MHKTEIIAEAGVNHNGDIAQAKRLVKTAVDAGADYVKFQTFKADKLVTKSASKAHYQKALTDQKQSHYEMIRSLEINREMHLELIAFCNSEGIAFLSTPFDIDSIDLLLELGLKKLKIPSGEITNLPYLRYIGSVGVEIIISTGMATLLEIKDAINVLKQAGCITNKIKVLHCNTEYPTPVEDVNLNAMSTIRDELGIEVGYSDHTLGTEIPVAAVAMGACIIEKHLTLDRSLSGPDHNASLTPAEFENMVLLIRNIEKALGDGVKVPSQSEKKNISITRKSIVANCNIKKGEIYSEVNLTVKRPALGISPMKWDELIGQPAQKDFDYDEIIQVVT
jgi:N,N'-diacetyllegionaminate synthase